MDENSKFERKKSLDRKVDWQRFCFRLGLLIACQVSLLSTSDEADAQALSQVRNAARSVSPSPPRNDDCDDDDDDRHHHHHHYHSNDGGNIVGDLIGALLFGTSSSTSSNDNSRNSLTSGNSPDIDYEIYSIEEPSFSFLEYPYANNQYGIGAVDAINGDPLKTQLAFWYGTDFDNIDSWNTQFRIESQDFYGFEFQWAHLTEKLTGVPRDSLNLADFNITGRWIESPEFILRAGVGVNLLVDRFGTEADYNLTLSSDFFPSKPCVISFELDHGEIGSTHQTHLLSTIGFNYKRAEILTGYEYRKVGRTEIQGPLLGVRLWW